MIHPTKWLCLWISKMRFYFTSKLCRTNYGTFRNTLLQAHQINIYMCHYNTAINFHFKLLLKLKHIIQA